MLEHESDGILIVHHYMEVIRFTTPPRCILWTPQQFWIRCVREKKIVIAWNRTHFLSPQPVISLTTFIHAGLENRE
jgi:hypothetical protein